MWNIFYFFRLEQTSLLLQIFGRFPGLLGEVSLSVLQGNYFHGLMKAQQTKAALGGVVALFLNVLF